MVRMLGMVMMREEDDDIQEMAEPAAGLPGEERAAAERKMNGKPADRSGESAEMP